MFKELIGVWKICATAHAKGEWGESKHIDKFVNFQDEFKIITLKTDIEHVHLSTFTWQKAEGSLPESMEFTNQP